LSGSADPKVNNRLRIAIAHAKEVNFPSENIDRVIKKASSDSQDSYHEMQYELYGHGGVGIILDVMTDNKNRIATDIKIATNKRGGTVAVPGAVAFNFDRKGVIVISRQHAVEDQLFAAATDAGAEDFSVEDDCFVITTEPVDLFVVKDAIEKLGFRVDDASIQMLPKNSIEVDEETARANMALVDWLESIDDVDAVYHNMAATKIAP
jgi:YebC/PmpR family DNA-binding regulatory protein